MWRSWVILASLACWAPAPAAWIWVEGEKPAQSTMNRHPWWYDQVKRELLSGGDLISNFSDRKAGEATYRFEAPKAGEYEFWVRANPLQTRLSYKLNNAAEWVLIATDKEPRETLNIAADGKPDLRFVAWIKVGRAPLVQGTNTLSFLMDSRNNNHGYLDCFVLSSDPLTPRGTLKPDQLAEADRQLAERNKGWFVFAPKDDPFGDKCPVDLRGLNEKAAGESGPIGVKGGSFVHPKTGATVRFWGVNGPPESLKDRDALRRCARLLAKNGVNLVRLHRGYFDAAGQPNPEAVTQTQEVVEACKAEGIYTHLSIYFPLWFRPPADTPWLAGYDGKTVPFAALFFNPDFQRQYQGWWRALLTTPHPTTKRKLVDEPALFGAELINEDSFFFWTFNTKALPGPQLRLLESQFGEWVKRRYGTLEAALTKWNNLQDPRDNFLEGRVGFRPLWNMFNERTPRDQDTTRFLTERQRAFYEDTQRFLRGLGYKGLITCSNWATASPQHFGPLEKYTYTVGDFIDRHGYFGCALTGPNAEWSVQNGHTWFERSALRFDAEAPDKPKQFVHPVMDPSYDGKPSMISETTFCRPNRYRSEAPLLYAAYGALQDSDALVHFALDSSHWTVKPNFFMQPWTLLSPAMLGQFPAAALLYRQGLVAPGDLMVNLNLKLDDLLALKGTPLPQDAAFDELRLKDVPSSLVLKPGNVLDPLVHFVGRTNVSFSKDGGWPQLRDLRGFVDRKAQTVTSSTKELKLDYGKGVLTINAPAAQGVSGDLSAAGQAELGEVSIKSDLKLGHVIAVSLDGEPLSKSNSILLQVATEEQPTDFSAVAAGGGLQRIANIGRDPWLVREAQGVVKFKRGDAKDIKVTALDENRYPAGDAGRANEIKLRPGTLYYHLSK